MTDCINILSLNLNNKEDYSDFNIILQEKLMALGIRNLKKILISAVELIQNNLIHNDNLKLELKIYRDNNYIFVETQQYLIPEICTQVINKISKINTQSISELKEIYQQNIKNTDNISQNAGNGFIICKLKSENNIDIKVIDENNRKKLLIKLKYKI